jgi:hypothetical protein
MKIADITEGYKLVWGRSKSKGVVRRYRCTDGPKKGRVVAKPSTCSSTVNMKRSGALKKTRRTLAPKQAAVRKNTLARPTATRVKSLNKRPKFRRAKGKSRRKFKGRRG